jgi:serine/threonine protein kinase
MVEDSASEKCTMPYRAPELFMSDLSPIIDQRTDVWVRSSGVSSFVVSKKLIAYSIATFKKSVQPRLTYLKVNLLAITNEPTSPHLAFLK